MVRSALFIRQKRGFEEDPLIHTVIKYNSDPPNNTTHFVSWPTAKRYCPPLSSIYDKRKGKSNTCRNLIPPVHKHNNRPDDYFCIQIEKGGVVLEDP